jgi:two-component system, OmpR family, response regulator
MRVLVIEDDEPLCEFLRLSLEEAGYEVSLACSAVEARARATDGEYDALVMDLMLPDMNGFDLTRELRRSGITAPILMLTAKREMENLVRGLDAGADDYLTKPFQEEELLARLRAILRRGAHRRQDQLMYAGLLLDRIDRQVRDRSRTIRLTPKEFSLLEFFLLRPEQIVARSTLLAQIWGIHFDPGSNIVDVHVTRLRNKLRDASAQLVTVRGRGYMLTSARQDDVAGE